jgi:hypothetical protein
MPVEWVHHRRGRGATMPTMITLIRVDFTPSDTNSLTARREKVIARFKDEPGSTAQQKMDDYLFRAFIRPLYRGWDSKIYPQFELKVEKID